MGKNLARVVVLNFITAFIIALITCDILFSFNLKEVLYIGNLFGLYFFAVYGINMLIQGQKIENSYRRILIALIFIIVFDIAFLIAVPLLFGPDALAPFDSLTLIFNGVRLDLILSTIVYLVIFGLIILFFNYLLAKAKKY